MVNVWQSPALEGCFDTGLNPGSLKPRPVAHLLTYSIHSGLLECAVILINLLAIRIFPWNCLVAEEMDKMMMMIK